MCINTKRKLKRMKVSGRNCVAFFRPKTVLDIKAKSFKENNTI